MKSPLVSVIIVNRNGGEVFDNCLESLAKISYPNWELVVVDNGSTDGSVDAIKKSEIGNRKSEIIRNKANLGFAKANNQGYEISKGEYILLLNNDIKVEKDFLAKLVSRIEKDKKIGVIQPKIYLMNDPDRLDTVGSDLTFTGFLQHWGYLKKDSDEFSNEKYIFSAKGACMLIRREVIKKIGLFDEDFGSYFEETDFCWRVWLTGSKIIYYPRTFIHHRVGYTSKRQNQLFVNYHSFKNRIATLLKNLGFINVVMIGGIHFSLVVGLSLYYLLTLRLDKSKMIWSAIFWNLKNIESTLAKRKIVQQRRVLSDGEIFEFILKPFNWREMLAHFIRSEKMLSGEHKV